MAIIELNAPCPTCGTRTIKTFELCDGTTSFVYCGCVGNDFIGDQVRELIAKHNRNREIEAMKIEAYLGIVPRVLYYDADGTLLPARI